jgi:hypothetical protein
MNLKRFVEKIDKTGSWEIKCLATRSFSSHSFLTREMTSLREMVAGKKALKKERKDIDTFAHSLNQLDGGGNIFIQIIL